jgi:carboxymethylenebutenolidase
MIIKSDESSDIVVPGTAQMRIHLFRPVGEGRFPSVTLFSEIYQVTAPIRRLASMVAGLGYLVAVPEVYHEFEPAGTVLTYDPSGSERGNALKFMKTTEQYDADATATLNFLAVHPACSGQLATMGVCLGGHLALRAARDPRVLAAACFYATDLQGGTLGSGGDDTLAQFAGMTGELMLVWGRHDPHVPFASRQILRERLQTAGARYEWHEVDGAHAFLRDEGPRYDPALFLQAMAWVAALFGRTLHRSGTGIPHVSA